MKNQVWIYDIIGYGDSTTAAVARQVADANQTEPLTVRINSDGGIVTEGYGIYNNLRRHQAGVVVEIDGIAASAASLIAMAGDKIRMADGTFLMIHRSWGGIVGNQMELPTAFEQIMSSLKTIDDTLVSRYSARSGIKPDKMSEMLTAETWIVASDAVELGLADEVINDFRAVAFVEENKWNYKNIPKELIVPPGIAAECRKLYMAASQVVEASNEIAKLAAQDELKQKTSRIENLRRHIEIQRKRLGAA